MIVQSDVEERWKSIEQGVYKIEVAIVIAIVGLDGGRV